METSFYLVFADIEAMISSQTSFPGIFVLERPRKQNDPNLVYISMRYAVISCVHGNLPALRAVLKDADEQGCGSILCLGDFVGFGDYPKECVELLRSRCVAAVKGNFDEMSGGTWAPHEGLGREVIENIERTRAELSPMDREYLSTLPLQLELDGFTLVHATLDMPERWQYIFDKFAASAHFHYQRTSLCFVGHTHVPMAFMHHKGKITGEFFSMLNLESDAMYLVNVGSVGQPRDGNPKAAYVIYDKAKQTVELRRIAYPLPPPGGEGVAKPSGGKGPLKTLDAHAKLPDQGGA